MANRREEARVETIPYLPKCVGTQAVKPSQPGVWEHNRALLEILAKGLDVKGTVDWSSLTSIPSIWARPLLFTEALVDPTHPLHKQVRDEWRGLLGLFCLHDYNLLNLTVHRVQLGQQDRRNPLVAALFTLMPKPEDSWCEIALVEVDGVMLGGTSPKTLLYSAADYRCPQQVPWKDERTGRLVDPLTVLARRNDPASDYAALKIWVGALQKHVTAAHMPAMDDVVKGQFVAQLQQWYNDIPGVESADIKFLSDQQLFARAGMSELYANMPPGVQDTRGNISDFFIEPTKATAVPAILVTDGTWHQHEARVLRSISPAEVGYPRDERGDVLDNGRIKHTWIRPDLYFLTDKILKLPTVEKNNVCPHKDGFVPPLRREILDYFEPNDLAGLFKWENAPGGVKVTLRLPLKGKSQARNYAEVSRVYSPDDHVEQAPAPFIEAWPNFRAEDWKNYYCIAQVRARSPFGCYPVPADEAAKPVKRTDAILWALQKPPEAMVCTWDSHPVGLIPLRQPETLAARTPNLRWKASVDFGTSNTAVFLLRPDKTRPEKLTFEDRTIQITSVAEMPRRLFLYSHFFPPDKVDGVFPSHLRMIDDRGEALPQPVLDGIVLFVEPVQWTNILADDTGRLFENMKWAADNTVRKYIAAFLKQLLLMVGAEARVARALDIELSYSYPSAFSDSMIGQMDSFWTQIVSSAKAWGIQAELKKSETESVAACKYLQHERHGAAFATNRPQVSLDIGGGTTDVAVWLEGGMAAQSSLLLGGMQLADFVREKDQFREGLERILNVKVRRDLFAAHPPAVLNILLRQYGPKIVETLAQGYGEEPIFKRARTMLYMLLAGGLYYTGIVLRHLAASGKEIDSCDVFLAGNGARFVDWVSDKKRVFKSFEDMVRGGAGAGINLSQVEIHDQQDPKEEVARGLLYEFGPDTSIPEPTAILGEEGYKLDGQPIPWNYDVYANRVKVRDGKLELPTDFPELWRFVDLFNKQAAKLSLEPLSKDLAHPSKVRARIQESLARVRQESKEALIQPPFIEAARQLLDRLHEVDLPK
jgi:hypothetical protein